MDLTLFDTKLSQIKSKNLDQIKTKSTVELQHNFCYNKIVIKIKETQRMKKTLRFTPVVNCAQGGGQNKLSSSLEVLVYLNINTY